jgi:hypothetical protein
MQTSKESFFHLITIKSVNSHILFSRHRFSSIENIKDLNGQYCKNDEPLCKKIERGILATYLLLVFEVHPK